MGDLQQRLSLVGAPRLDILAFHQRAAARRLDLANGLQPLARFHVEARDGMQQRLEVRVPGVAKDIVQAAAFHHLAVVHHDHLVGDVGDDAQVVRDDQHGHVELALKIVHQLQDLRLYRDVQRRRRLVGDQQRRAADQGHGDHRPLAQAAGELERIDAKRFFRGPGIRPGEASRT